MLLKYLDGQNDRLNGILKRNGTVYTIVLGVSKSGKLESYPRMFCPALKGGVLRMFCPGLRMFCPGVRMFCPEKGQKVF